MRNLVARSLSSDRRPSRRKSTSFVRKNDASGKALTSTSCKSSASEASSMADSKSLTDEKMIQTLPIPRQEVIRRLRFLKQLMTLFGEDDQVRLDRLEYVLKEGLFEVDSDMTQGQTNDFLHKSGKIKTRDDKREETRDDDDDFKLLNANFDDLCDEDKILVLCKKLLIEWKQELDAMENTERRTATAKHKLATFNQCARNKGLPADIRQGLMAMVNFLIKRDYLAANGEFIKLAIGNAPWPIGVTMVGIHERSAREKICTNSVAHIMNNETTRKYLQSVKRLMTFCQRRCPSMPSKAFEFNSLANERVSE